MYPALAGNDASGIKLVAAPHPFQPGDYTGPSFPLRAPEGPAVAEHWPIAGTIRHVGVGVPGVSAWIAESYGAGVCVLAWDGGTANNVSAVGFSCSPPGAPGRGAQVELRDMPSRPGKVLRVGVVPSGTKSVAVELTDGATATIPVGGNAWAYLADEASLRPGAATALKGR